MNTPLRYLLPLAIFVLFASLAGCGKKEKSGVEQNKSGAAVSVKEHNTSAAKTSPLAGNDSFTLTNYNGINHTMTVAQDHIRFLDIDKPIVILHFFTTWSQPCRGEAPYLSDLQVKYQKELAILGILLHPDNYLEELDSFVEKNRLAYFISSGSQNDAFAKAVTKQLSLPEMLPIPLTVIYHNGRYYKHYEGVVPVEMLVHDIKTLLK